MFIKLLTLIIIFLTPVSFSGQVIDLGVNSFDKTGNKYFLDPNSVEKTQYGYDLNVIVKLSQPMNNDIVKDAAFIKKFIQVHCSNKTIVVFGEAYSNSKGVTVYASEFVNVIQPVHPATPYGKLLKGCN